MGRGGGEKQKAVQPSSVYTCMAIDITAELLVTVSLLWPSPRSLMTLILIDVPINSFLQIITHFIMQFNLVITIRCSVFSHYQLPHCYHNQRYCRYIWIIILWVLLMLTDKYYTYLYHSFTLNLWTLIWEIIAVINNAMFNKDLKSSCKLKKK